ncbi:ribose 5-phosphate isomerase B [Blastopirellula marina]|uniref:Ribose 5-phosphate isomerase B n=1 Tax=Blastopirellula marina TaxID=124 RepID=A0A2S8FPJ0_9BACT|nr:ribose 5-phosphate isomerase B [Blastopirellula marina]PQO33930.1 ribose 5-phosphate isomerase B [Blastopirellula marina]PTL43716.1 ribose 5-phosphate isomerase B [Blastopirellula marina]
MKIAIGSDHRGFEVKAKIIEHIKKLGHDAIDCGAHDCSAIDYPDIASAVSEKIVQGDVDRGILICGSGIGMAITANKFPGVRAATCHDDLTAEMSRRHNNVNVMCLSADLLGERLIDRMVDLWINTAFEKGRHQRRVDKISEVERRFSKENL